MKKYLLVTLAVVLSIAFSAFTGKQSIASKADSVKQTSYYWFDGTSYDALRTKSAEMTATGCPDNGSLICRNGYGSDDLIDPAHPELGLKGSATVDITIKKVS